MKKLLALVLSLVMVLGLATVGASAALDDFPDAADVNNEEAMAVMNAVGVFTGKDGKLAPKDNLTRAEAAKLVAYLALGEKTAEALPAVQVYSDVPATHWAAKYVAYGKNSGIINGTSATTFDPNGALTGYAFGAYILAVLGYDRNIEGMTGENWAINTAKLMQSNDITKGVSGAGSETLTREAAAQYCLNALKADTVDYSNKGTTVTVNGIDIVTGASAASSVADKTDVTAHKAIKNEYKVPGDVTVVQLGEKLYDGDLKLTSSTDAFGQPAKTWKYETTEIDTYTSAPDEVLKNGTSYGDLYTTLGKTVVENINTFQLFIDGVEVANKSGHAVATVAGSVDTTLITKGSKADFAYDTDSKTWDGTNTAEIGRAHV